MKDVVAILAGGPSLTQEIADQVRAAGVFVVAINDSWKLVPDADELLAADAPWWKLNPDALGFRGKKVVLQQAPAIAGVEFVSPRPLGTGGNSALQAAYRASGAKRLLLFGVDLRDDELTHHHGLHPTPLNNPSVGAFRRARAAWEVFSRQPGIPETINCSARSALTCFPKMAPEQALCL